MEAADVVDRGGVANKGDLKTNKQKLEKAK